MITSIINGGLGNQIFQYAAGRNLSQINSTGLILDTCLYNNPIDQTERSFALDKYNIVFESIRRESSRLNNIFKLGFYRLVNKPRVYKEQSYNFDFNVLKLGNDVTLAGYWQSYKYFNQIKRQLQLELKPKNKTEIYSDVMKAIESGDSVAVHIRRGDYISNPKANDLLGILPVDYYKEAIKYIESNVNNPIFLIFSDDIEWCRKNIPHLTSHRIIFIDENDVSDLDIMTKTRHNIIANSTYSWWGAYLGDKSIVISPKNWFKSTNMSTIDLILPTWVQI